MSSGIVAARNCGTWLVKDSRQCEPGRHPSRPVPLKSQHNIQLPAVHGQEGRLQIAELFFIDTGKACDPQHGQATDVPQRPQPSAIEVLRMEVATLLQAKTPQPALSKLIL